MNIIHQIRYCSRFTLTEHQLAEYVLHHRETVAHMSMKALMDATFVSKSMIHRFCKKLGLNGFNELRIQLMECKETTDSMMSTFFFYLPAVLLSGFMFPIANMPEVVQAVTYLNPLRYFLVIIRGIFLKGVGVAILWPQIMALLILGILVLTLAVKKFRKSLA